MPSIYSQFSHVWKSLKSVLDRVLVKDRVQAELDRLERNTIEELLKDVDALVSL